MKYSRRLSFPYSKALCLVFLVVNLLIVSNLKRHQQNRVINWDVSGYYMYLPAYFIYHDLAKLDFYLEKEAQYKFTGEGNYYDIQYIPSTGNRLIKYSCGVALFELPGFIIAHAIANLSKVYPADGFSLPYQLLLQWSTILFSFGGLWLLRSFLRTLGYSDGTTTLVLLLLGFGTNLYYYSAFEQGMAHPYSFFLVAGLLRIVQGLRNDPGGISAYGLLGLASGLLVLIRPVDIILLIIPVAFLIIDGRSLRFWLAQKWRFILAIGIALFVFVPQLLYWNLITGHYIYYSYAEEGFYFLDSHIWDGLFSYRKGWFIYTPVTLVAVIVLFVGFLSEELRKYSTIVVPILFIYLYVVFSWYMWYYGGSFGSRVMINFLPFLAWPLAYMARYLVRISTRYSATLYLLLVMMVMLNIFQSWQYSHAIIHYSDMNRESYWRVFLQTELSEKDRKLLYKRSAVKDVHD